MKHVLMAGLCLFFTMVQCVTGSTASAQVKKPSSQSPAKTSARHKPEITIHSGHAGSITTLAFSPDGRFLLSGGSDSTLKIWDTTNWRLVRTLSAPVWGITTAALSPDGQKVVSANGDKTLNLWDITTGQLLQTLKGHSEIVSSVAYSPDSRFVLSGSDDTSVKLWDVATGREIRSFIGHSGSVVSVAFHPNGQWILSASVSGEITLWECETGAVVRSLTGLNKTVDHGSGNRTQAIFTPDGKFVLSGSYDKVLRLWETSTGQLIRSFVGHSTGIRKIACSPDGKSAVSVDDRQNLKRWNISTGQEIGPDLWNQASVTSVLFSPDSQKLVIGTDHQELRILDLTGLTPARTIQFPQTATELVRFSPDIRQAVSFGIDGRLRMWDIETRQELWEIPGKPDMYFPQSFSPDSTTLDLFGSNGVIQRVETQTGRVVQSVATGIDQVFGAAISPSGRYLATINQDQVTIWDTTTGQPPSFTSDFCSPPFLSFSPDESSVLVQFDEYTFKLWSVPDGRELRSFGGFTRPISTARFSSNGKYILSQDTDQGLTVWETASGRLIQTLAGNKENVHLSTDISLDGSLIALGGSQGVIQVWDVRSGRKIRTYLESTGPITSVKLSADGKSLFSASGNTATIDVAASNTVKIWDLTQESNLQSIYNQVKTPQRLMLSPDGRYAVQRNGLGITLWEVNTGRQIRLLTGNSDWNVFTIDPQGKYICSGTSDGLVQLWDSQTGTLARTCDGHTDAITSVSLSPDGTYLVSGSRDKTIKVWDTSTALNIGTFSGHTKAIRSVAVSPDGKYIASYSDDRSLRLWETATRQEVWATHDESIDNQSLLFSPDGKFLTDRRSPDHKWDTQTGKKTAFLPLSSDRYGSFLCFTPDGKHQLTNGPGDSLIFSETVSHRVLRRYSGHWPRVFDLALSPDGRFILLASSDGVRLLSTATGQELYKMVAFTDGEWLTITPQGHYVASASGEQYLNVVQGNIVTGIDTVRARFNQPERVAATVKAELSKPVPFPSKPHPRVSSVTELPADKPVFKIQPPPRSSINSVQLSDDGRYAFSNHVRINNLWDLTTGRLIHRAKPGAPLAPGPNGSYFHAGKERDTLVLSDLATGRELRAFPGLCASIDTIVVSGNGRFLLTRNGLIIKVWEIETGRLIQTIKPDTGGFSAPQITFNGQFVLTEGKEKIVNAVDVASGQVILTIPGYLSMTQVSRDGKYVLSNNWGVLKVWGLSTGRLLWSIPIKNALVAVSPDSRLILSQSTRTLFKLWDAATGREISAFSVPETNPNHEFKLVCFSPDGKLVLMACSDKTFRLWEVMTGRQIHTFKNTGDFISMLAFRADGKYFLSTDHKGIASVWSVSTGQRVVQFSAFENGDWVALAPTGEYTGSDNAEKYLTAQVGSQEVGISQLNSSQRKPTLESLGYKPVQPGSILQRPKYTPALVVDTLPTWVTPVKKPAVFLQLGHINQIIAGAISSDENTIIAVEEHSRMLKLWSAQSGRQLHSVLMPFTMYRNNVRLSPDGQYALFIKEKSAVLWDLVKNQEIRTLPGHTDSIESSAFHLGRQVIATGSWDKTIKLWSITTGQIIHTLIGHSAQINSVAFSPDGQYLASGSNDQTVKVWNVATGKEIQTLTGHLKQVIFVAFSPDGKNIGAKDSDLTTKVWDLSSRQEVKPTPKDIFPAILSPKGKYIVNQPGLTRLWEAGTGKPISDVTGSGQVLGFSPDERLVLRQGNGKGGPSLWEIASGCTVRQFARNQLIIRRLRVSPDGRYLILVGPDNQYKDHQVVWDLVTGQVVQRVNDASIDDLTFHPLGHYWATVDKTKKITLSDVPSGHELRSWKADSKGVTTMAFSPDGQYLITANSKMSGCTIWDAATGDELRTIAGEQSDIWLISFTLDGSGIITSNDKQTRIWDLTTGDQLPTFNHQSIDLSSSIISRDRRYAILKNSHSPYKLWQIENGREITTFDGANEEIWSFVVSRDGKTLLTGSQAGKLQIWDTETGKELRGIPTGSDPIHSIALSPDEQFAFLVCQDGTIHIWDLVSGQERLQLAAFQDGEWVALTPEGYYAASPKGDQYLNVRVGNQVTGIDSFRNKFNQPEKVKQVFSQFPAQQRK